MKYYINYPLYTWLRTFFFLEKDALVQKDNKIIVLLVNNPHEQLLLTEKLYQFSYKRYLLPSTWKCGLLSFSSRRHLIYTELIRFLSPVFSNHKLLTIISSFNCGNNRPHKNHLEAFWSKKICCQFSAWMVWSKSIYYLWTSGIPPLSFTFRQRKGTTVK